MYPASYAALTALTETARQWSPVDRQTPLVLAGAIADGHPDAARNLTFVFGRARCADCDAVFGVAEAVTARWSP